MGRAMQGRAGQAVDLAAGEVRWANCSFPFGAYRISSEGEVQNAKGVTMKLKVGGYRAKVVQR